MIEQKLEDLTAALQENTQVLRAFMEQMGTSNVVSLNTSDKSAKSKPAPVQKKETVASKPEPVLDSKTEETPDPKANDKAETSNIGLPEIGKLLASSSLSRESVQSVLNEFGVTKFPELTPDQIIVAYKNIEELIANQEAA